MSDETRDVEALARAWEEGKKAAGDWLELNLLRMATGIKTDASGPANPYREGGAL